MPAIRVFELALGSVIEFNRSCNEPLILTANGRPIGSGEAVKVGEHFGLRHLNDGSPTRLIVISQ